MCMRILYVRYYFVKLSLRICLGVIMRIGQMSGGLVEIIRRRGGAVLVRPLNRVKPLWVQDVKLVKPPERGMSLRMAKEVEFSQECGCTAVVEFLVNGRVESFNVYGDLEKYVSSGVRKGSKLSDHHRRVALREDGFLRGRGLKRRVKAKVLGRKIRQFERNGYEII